MDYAVSIFRRYYMKNISRSQSWLPWHDLFRGLDKQMELKLNGFEKNDENIN